MSKIGKKSILIPEGVSLTQTSNEIKVKGPKGELSLSLMPDFEIEIKGQELKVLPKIQNRQTPVLWGTQRALLNNAVLGVSQGFQKSLVIEGLGYSVQLQGDMLVLKIGYSHPVNVKIPRGLQVKIDKNVVTIFGIDKNKVGQFAASVRALKKPEPYKGKGIRYEKEVVRRKAGKKVVGAGTVA